MQPSLFDGASDLPPDAARLALPRARRTDPATSHQAAAEVIATGAAQRHRGQILAALAGRDGMTSEEIAAAAGMDRVAVARRMKELEADGKVRRGEARASRGSKRPGVTWFLVKEGAS